MTSICRHSRSFAGRLILFMLSSLHLTIRIIDYLLMWEKISSNSFESSVNKLQPRRKSETMLRPKNIHTLYIYVYSLTNNEAMARSIINLNLCSAVNDTRLIIYHTTHLTLRVETFI